MRSTLGEILAKRAFVSPELEAVVDVATGRRITFAELDDRVNRTAHALRRLGVSKGDRVGLLMMNSVSFIDAYLGAARLGAVIVPLNWRLTPAELRFILGDSGVSVLVFGDEFSATAAELHGTGLDGLDRWLHVGEDVHRPGFAVDFDDVRADQRGAATADVDERDLLYVMYTSGTTGRPKGVMHTHGTTFAAVVDMGATMDYRYGDRYLNCMPLFHVGALQPANACVYRGCTTVLMRAFDAVQAWEQIGREQVTSLLAVPAMLSAMAESYEPDRHDCSALRWIITAGSPVPVSLLERYVSMGVNIIQGYGLTEAGGPVTVLGGADAVSHLGSAGKASFHSDVRIVDRDGGDVAPGATGEIVVRNAATMVGYWNRPEASAAVLRGGWLHTGDVAGMDAGGYVTIHDRLTDLIISGGENIYPAEIEDVILSHPGVAEVAVIAQPSARWGESPCAVVVPADPELDPSDIMTWCEGRLARFKTPKAVEFVEEIPRNPSGKALKRILRDRFPGPAPA
jgi:acyl-CoA synthetase (AMP-forming)/AMP-acid ligase II